MLDQWISFDQPDIKQKGTMSKIQEHPFWYVFDFLNKLLLYTKCSIHLFESFIYSYILFNSFSWKKIWLISAKKKYVNRTFSRSVFFLVIALLQVFSDKSLLTNYPKFKFKANWKRVFSAISNQDCQIHPDWHSKNI